MNSGVLWNTHVLTASISLVRSAIIVSSPSYITGIYTKSTCSPVFASVSKKEIYENAAIVLPNSSVLNVPSKFKYPLNISRSFHIGNSP